MEEETLEKIITQCFNVKKFPLNDKGMYEGYWQEIGYDRKWFDPESTYWWVEDLVIDTLKKEKVFGDRQILSTRHLIGKDRGSLGAVFKGPISKIDLWMPGYGFAEVKYTADGQRDYWGYDLDNRAITNICSIRNLEFNMKHPLWKNNKLFLIVVHAPDPGDSVSISVIDLDDQFDFTEDSNDKPLFHPSQEHVCVSVDEENCLARFDEVPYRTYHKRCYEEE